MDLKDRRHSAIGIILVVNALIGWSGTYFCVRLVTYYHFDASYGLGLFCGVPVTMGVVASMIGQRYGVRSSGWVAMLSIFLCGLGLLGTRIDGLICLIMALPVFAVFVLLGLLLGQALTSLLHLKRGVVLMPVLLLTPFLTGVSLLFREPPPLRSVTTQIEIAAPPEIVWKDVIRFADLPEPSELLFKAGIAYPIRARIEGTGPGAVRYCEFSTGAFVEPIEIWDEPRLLRFAVTHNPEPLRELSPYGAIHPPHLNGYFSSEQGQFLLRPLPGGKTLLTGTTWYRINMQPGFYWRLWCDSIVHRIHLRVLRHIKALSERRTSA